MYNNRKYPLKRSSETFGKAAISTVMLSAGAIGSCLGGMKARVVVTDLTNPILGIVAGLGTVIVGIAITNALENAVTERLFDNDIIANIQLSEIYKYEPFKTEQEK